MAQFMAFYETIKVKEFNLFNFSSL